MKDSIRLSSATSDTSEIRAGSLALGFLGFLYAMAIGSSASRPPDLDYGYDEQLGDQTASTSGATLVANCTGRRAAVAEAPIDGLDELGAGATGARGGPPSTAELQTHAIGGHHVE
jgi:hypothetical protein